MCCKLESVDHFVGARAGVAKLKLKQAKALAHATDAKPEFVRLRRSLAITLPHNLHSWGHSLKEIAVEPPCKAWFTAQFVQLDSHMAVVR